MDNAKIKYNEKQANSFWAAFDAATVKKLLEVIDKQIDFDKSLKEDNDKVLAEHEKGLDKAELKWKDRDAIKAPLIEFANDFEKFEYSFNKLIQRWKTLLHDTDEAWNLNIKIFDVAEEFNYRLVWTYKVEIKDVDTKAKNK